MRFLDLVEFLLLIGREQRTDLRHRLVHDRMSFVHRLLVNGDDLRSGLVDQRLDLRLLIRRQVQSMGQLFKRKSPRATVPSTPTARAGLCLGKNKAAQRDGAGYGECKQVSFHSFLFLVCFNPEIPGVFQR